MACLRWYPVSATNSSRISPPPANDPQKRPGTDQRAADILKLERRHPRRDDTDRDYREPAADHAGHRGHGHCLRNGLSRDVGKRRAQRLPDGGIALLARGAREHQVGGVGAGDQQHEDHRSEQDVQRRADALVASDCRPPLGVEGIQRIRHQGIAVAQRSLLAQAAADRGELVAGLLERRVRPAPAESVHLVRTRYRRLGIPVRRHPRLRAGIGKTERCRHDAHHPVPAPVDVDLPVVRHRIDGSDLSPQVFPDHDRIGPVARGRMTPVDRRHAEHR